MSYSALVVASLATVFVAAVASATEPSKPASSATSTNASVTKPATTANTASRKTQPAASGDSASAVQTPVSPHGTQSAGAGAEPAKKQAPAKPEKKVDLNNASLAELQTLPTVGESEAKKIVANRPYKSKMELVTKAGLPDGVYYAVRYKVELQKPRQAAAKK